MPLYAIFFLSPNGMSSSLRMALVFSTATDSPVRAASSILKCAASIILKSDGTIRPASKTTMSPRAIADVGMFMVCSCLITVDIGSAIFLSASIAFSALYSWMKPTIALSITMTIMAIVSDTSPINPEIIAAAISTMIMKSLNCSRNIASADFLFFSIRVFAPCVRRRFFASSWDNPEADVSNMLITSFMFLLCQFIFYYKR
ncbi:hypothetical protein MCHI_003503 [Candidatus Magnetoovum chiemensis]|nr:hypothetical protein MCHI_003503 [Candidatus Magnetoovum chiemensis]